MSKSEIANMYADKIISEKLSIRETAKVFGVSKSKVHDYVSKYTTGILRRFLLKRRLRKNSK